MKEWFLSVLGCFISWMAAAQQEMGPNVCLLDPYRYNSACSGFSHGLNLSLIYANQWLGMEGAPREISFSAHQLWRETNFSMGGLLFCEKSGVSQRIEVEIAGTYRFLVADWTWLSLSVGGGARVMGKDFSSLDNDGDTYFDKQKKREVVPRFRMGAWLKWEDGSSVSFSVKGVGVGHLNSFGHKQATHFYWSGEHSFPMRRNRWLCLKGMVYMAKYSPIAMLVAPALNYSKKWKMGWAYQTGRSFTPFVEFKIGDDLTCGCSYTYSMLRRHKFSESSCLSFLMNYRIISDEKGRERLYRNAPL